jgi:3-deoxy-D-manno-octulosonic acid kinase
MLTKKMIWGAVPDGFSKIVDAGGDFWVVRQDRSGEIDASVCRDDFAGTARREYQGRAALRAIRLRDGEIALVRSYRHGGLLRGLTGGCFFTWPPRPFRELAITEELRRRGLRTVEVYAACVRRLAGPIYRGWLVTRELRDASDLWKALQSDLARRNGIHTILKAAADTVRAMHREGVYHADLNLKNILIRTENSGVEGYVIDFDKAHLFLGKLPPEFASKNLERLLRSARKLDPERRYLTAAAWKEFLNFYHGGADA